MDHNRHIETCKRFYAEGGYAKAPSKSSRLGSVEKALYASQYYAEGGPVGGDDDYFFTRGRMTPTPEDRRDNMQARAFSNALDYALRETPDPPPVDYSALYPRTYQQPRRQTTPSQFADGGPVFTPPENMGHASPQKLAYASQFFADGGQVAPLLMAMLGDRLEVNGDTYESRGPWGGGPNHGEYRDFVTSPQGSAEAQRFRSLPEADKDAFNPRYLKMFNPNPARRPSDKDGELLEMWRKIEGCPTS